MTRLSLAALCLAVPALSACVVIDADDDNGNFRVNYDYSSAGTVYGAEVLPGVITFRVTSNGCTDESYFDLDVENEGSREYTVELQRTRSDTCRAMLTEGTEVSWTFDELGLPDDAKIFINNEVARY